VVARRHGKHVFYSLADDHIAQLIANGLAHGLEKEKTG
jgi:DNA-binding transcriptional ArsR family regulator